MGTNRDPNDIKPSLLGTLFTLFGHEKTVSSDGRLARFESTVENLVQSHGSAILGRLHFLNLEELIVRRGEGKKTRLKKAENLILSIIGQNLKEGETYVRPEVEVIWFLFPSLTREAGDLKCAAIADQIARALTEDDPIFSDLKSERTVQQIDRQTWIARKKEKSSGSQPAATGRPAMARPQRSARIPRRESSSTFSDMYTDSLLASISVGYQAIWNVRSKLITSYAAVPRRRYSDGATVTGKWIMGTDTGFAPVAALDSLVQRKSVAELRGLMKTGRQTILVLPVHFSTVDNQSLFMPYSQELAGLSPDERKHVVFEVLHAPDALPGFRAKDIMARLHPLARAVLVQVSPDSTRIRFWAEDGAHAVGFATEEERLPEKILMEKMNAFVARAEEAGIHACAHGVTTPSLAMAAVAAGFRYVGGAAILPESAALKPIEPFECRNIFTRAIGA